MADVITHSTRFLTAPDIHAMVVYLRTIPAQATGPLVAAAKPVPAADGLGAHIFATACQGCHLPDGAGRQSNWAALAGSHSTVNATNMLQILAHGSNLETPHGNVFMHAFTGAYTDTEIAAVANYVSAQIGGRDGSVSAGDVARARE
jgi:mono/diheme cytochrome c family protein